jgi:predicted PurR-regulated permease PerM
MLYIARSIIVPVIYSVIIAIVLTPVVDFFVKRKLNRVLAIGMTLALLIIFTIAAIVLLSSQMMVFSDTFPDLVRKFHELTAQSIAWVSENFNISTRKINTWLAEKNKSAMTGAGAALNQTLINTGGVLIILVLIPVYTFMILFYQPLLIAFIHKLFKAVHKDEVNAVLAATKKIIRSYLIGLLIEAAIIAILNCSALLILGIDYAILLGVIGAMVNVIPYIGGFIAVALPMIIALTTKSPAAALSVFGVYVIIQFIDNHYIIPKVVASKVQINALMSIVVVLCGGALWGVPGMFLSIPLIAILKVIFDHIEPLKPWGYLLGDSMPPLLGKYSPFKKVTN